MDYNKAVADEYRDFFNKAEAMFQDFYNRVLSYKAKLKKAEQLIKFNRENIFTNMFCFAKKLYIGNVIDNEGSIFPMGEIDKLAMTEEEWKDNNTQVGAVLVDKYRRIIGCGYNGFISGVDESLFPTSRDIDLPYNLTKYPYTIHAEQSLHPIVLCHIPFHHRNSWPAVRHLCA